MLRPAVQLSDISHAFDPAEIGELSTAAAAVDAVCCYDHMYSWAGLAGQSWTVLDTAMDPVSFTIIHLLYILRAWGGPHVSLQLESFASI